MRKALAPITAALGALILVVGAPGARAESSNDRTQILQEVVYQYAYAWDVPDCAKVAAVFTADGVLDFRGHPTLAAPDSLSTGPRQIRDYCQSRVDALAAGSQWFHYMTNPIITITGTNRAKGQVMGLVLIRTSPTATPTIAAVITYDDTYVKKNGKWLLQRRIAK
jgi:hypothetical protein